MCNISVIMPIFNAEAYLENTLNSVINQTMDFENIELILVDDCSTDNSRTILEQYGKKYPNIKNIFLEENTGCPGIPRNIGIENATSDYIMFIDNDDEYLPEICERLYNAIISEEADVVVCNTLFSDNYGSTQGTINSNKFVYDDEIIYFDNGFIWNCIFKKSIILDNNICFVDGVLEDSIFTLEYYLHSHKLVYLNDFVGYNHFERDDSTSLSFDWEINAIKAFKILVELLNSHECDLNRYFKNKIQAFIICAIILGKKNEINGILQELYTFEKNINFTGNLPPFHQFINFFILHGNLKIATYICLFISTFRKSDLLLKIHRKVFLKFYRKHS